MFLLVVREGKFDNKLVKLVLCVKAALTARGASDLFRTTAR